MQAWTDGYVSDIEYTTGFYRELSPSFLSFAAALRGCHAPDPNKPFTYCELACGQGFGTNLLAAAYPHGEFYGLDFNPAQIANAQGLASDAQLSNVTFLDDSFAESLARPDDDLPQFDFITLHGIYAWISEENRRTIVQFIERKLKPGGLVYVSYNCMPGWAAMAPFQRFMREHANLNPDRSDAQVASAVEMLKKLNEGKGRYFQANPTVAPRMEKLDQQNRNYLAHEYLNGYWQPLYITDVAREMSDAKLNYTASASVLENFDALFLQAELRPVAAEIKDPIFRELFKDYAINQQFRRDIYTKGRRSFTSIEQQAIMNGLRFAPIVPREKMSFKFQTAVGEGQGQESVYAPICDALAEGKSTFVEIRQAASVDATSTLQALAALTSSGQIHPLVSDERAKAAQRTSRALNQAVAYKALIGQAYRYLAVPTIGNGMGTNEIDLSMLTLLLRNPNADAEALAQHVWSQFKPVGRRMMKDGQTLQTDEENLAELRPRVAEALEGRVPVWKRLGVL